MSRSSKVLFYCIALWCLIVGIQNQTITTADDLPWIAAALAGSDVDAFNPILAIWAHWIGMFLLTAGVSLAVIVWKVPDSRWSLFASSVIAVGTLGAQSYSVLSLGAYGPISYVLVATPVAAVLAAATGFLGLR